MAESEEEIFKLEAKKVIKTKIEAINFSNCYNYEIM